MRTAILLLATGLLAAPLGAQGVHLRAISVSTGPRLSVGAGGTALFLVGADLSLPWQHAGLARIELGTSKAPLGGRAASGVRRDREATLDFVRTLGSAARPGLAGVRPRIAAGIGLHWLRTDVLLDSAEAASSGRFTETSSRLDPSLQLEAGLALPLARHHRLDLDVAARGAALLGGPDVVGLRLGIRYALGGAPSGVVAGEPAADAARGVPGAFAGSGARGRDDGPGSSGMADAAQPAPLTGGGAGVASALAAAMRAGAAPGMIRSDADGLVLADTAFVDGHLRPSAFAALKRAARRLAALDAEVLVLARADTGTVGDPASLRAVAVARALSAGGLARNAVRLEVAQAAGGGSVALRLRPLSGSAAPPSRRR